MACRDENGTPEGVDWARVNKREMGEPPNIERIPVPLLCMQCASPACVDACEFDAMKIGAGGIVAVDEESCTGCAMCGPACPYEAIYFAGEYDESANQGLMNDQEQDMYTRWRKRFAEGTATKCDFCRHRLAKGREPACVAICPVNAHVFGDLNDPRDEVAKLTQKPGTQALHPEWNTAPKVFYFPPAGMTVKDVAALAIFTTAKK
jgi:molybdopterin-containing oxidoreductase family iron-sulfur binding subunit